MTQTIYQTVVDYVDRCQYVPDDVPEELAIWQGDLPQCTLSEILNIPEPELIEFVFRDGVDCTQELACIPRPPVEIAPVPLGSSGLNLAVAFLTMAVLLRFRGNPLTVKKGRVI